MVILLGVCMLRFRFLCFVLNFQVVIGREEVDAGELLTGVLVAWGSFSYRDQVGIVAMFLNFWFSF